MKQVRVRYAPSPTGYLHIGGLRTALYNYLFAKKNEGSFLLRIEDTDRNRLVSDAIINMQEILYRMGLNYDEGPDTDDKFGPYIQSERLDIYKEHALKLIKENKAYYCFCSSEKLKEMRKEQERLKLPTKYDQTCRHLSKEEVAQKLLAKISHVIRMRIPEDQEISFTDLTHGKIKIHSSQLDDQVLVKSDGYPTYHLAVVVDDHLMKISHVIRGEEWISSTPKHVLLYEYFGWETPLFSHLPLILNKDRSKLSKRQNDVSVESYLEKGFLPEALINYVALLGWNPKGDQEIYSMNELIELFDLSQINKSGAVFDLTKLEWMNAVYIRNLANTDLKEKCLIYLEKEYENLPDEKEMEKLLAVSKDRLKKLSDIVQETRWFFEHVDYDKELLKWKKANLEDAKNNLLVAFDLITEMDEKVWNHDALKEQIFTYLEEQNIPNGNFLWPLRVALSGLSASPSPFELLDVLGKDQSLKRIKSAIEKI